MKKYLYKSNFDSNEACPRLLLTSHATPPIKASNHGWIVGFVINFELIDPHAKSKHKNMRSKEKRKREEEEPNLGTI